MPTLLEVNPHASNLEATTDKAYKQVPRSTITLSPMSEQIDQFFRREG